MKQLTITTLISSLLLVASYCFGQDVEFKASNFKDDKDGLKKAVENIKSGDELMEEGMADFIAIKDPGDTFLKALFAYNMAHQFNPNSAELNMKIGACLLQTNRKAEAKTYIEKAYSLNKDIDPLIFFYLGQIAQLDMRFDEAIEFYKQFEEEAKNSTVDDYKKLSSKYKKECKIGKELVANKLRVWVDNLEDLNSDQDDYGPYISADEELMIFTSNRSNGGSANSAGTFDSDVYRSTLTGRTWGKPKAMEDHINSDKNEFASGLAYDGQRMMVATDQGGQLDVYESKLNGTKWTAPQIKMATNVNNDNNQLFASYDPGDVTIYYITDETPPGGKNIYFTGVMVRDINRWGKGISVSQNINTKFHEGSVYMHPDGQTMYFSSQGHNSMGGYDIFMSTRLHGQWTKPVNLGYPINTPYDDLFFVNSASGKYAYIASNRPGKGGLDIHMVTFWGPEKPVRVDSEDYLLASIAEPIKDKVIAQQVKVEKKSLTVFKGRVLDALTEKPIEAEIDITDNTKGEVISQFKSNSATGKFLLSLPSGKNYGIAVKAEGYLFHSENFNLPELSSFNLVNKDLALKNIAIGSKIALRNVFFETAKSEVTAESYPELDRLIQLLKDVPSLKIELGGHTDNVGSESSNLKLSQDRADAVKDYLIKKGISASRLQAKGYGSSKPVATNGTTEGRQENRRTEFEIIAN